MDPLSISYFQENAGRLRALLEELVTIESPTTSKAAVDRLALGACLFAAISSVLESLL